MIKRRPRPQLVSRHVIQKRLRSNWRMQAVISLDEQRWKSLKQAQELESRHG